MAQRPWFMQSGVNQFHHDKTMDDLSDRICFFSLLNRAQHERIRLEWTKVMLSRIQNRAPNGYLLAPHTGPVQHRPWFMQSGVNQFHHDKTMDDLSDRICFFSLLNRAQHERIRLEWTKVMLSRIQNRAPNGYLLAPHTGPVQHNNMGISLYQLPVWPESQGTGVYIPNYNRGSCKNHGNAQQKKQMQPTKSSGKREEKDMVPCDTSPEVALPKEWTY